LSLATFVQWSPDMGWVVDCWDLRREKYTGEDVRGTANGLNLKTFLLFCAPTENYHIVVYCKEAYS
jgi:hypothetical protein